MADDDVVYFWVQDAPPEKKGCGWFVKLLLALAFIGLMYLFAT